MYYIKQQCLIDSFLMLWLFKLALCVDTHYPIGWFKIKNVVCISKDILSRTPSLVLHCLKCEDFTSWTLLKRFQSQLVSDTATSHVFMLSIFTERCCPLSVKGLWKNRRQTLCLLLTSALLFVWFKGAISWTKGFYLLFSIKSLM